MDGFGNEGLTLLVVVDGDGEDFSLYKGKDFSGHEGIQRLKGSEFSI